MYVLNKLMIDNLKDRYFRDYLFLKYKKISFFKQHDLWKYRKMLIKLFDYPEKIKYGDAFAFELIILERILKLNVNKGV